MDKGRIALIITRRATLDDAAAIAQIQVDGWQTAYRGMIPDIVLDAMSVEARTKRWTEILSAARSVVLVAEKDDAVVGWSGFGKSRNEAVQRPTGEIYGFYVGPSAWRSGVGSAMWRASCGALIEMGFEAAELWVLEANAAARLFYEAMGCRLLTESAQLFDIEGYSIPEVKYGWE